MSKSLIKYLNPYRRGWMVGSIISGTLLLAATISMAVRNDFNLFGLFLVFAVLVFTLIPLIRSLMTIKNLEMDPEYPSFVSDFEKAVSMRNDLIRFGEIYIFSRRSGKVLKYTDITNAFQFIHKTNFAEDQRALKCIDKNGKTHILCLLELHGNSDDELIEMISFLISKNPDISISYHKRPVVQKTKVQSPPNSDVGYLDDVTFIGKIEHITNGPWHQYDVALAARAYGWDFMISWADYMTTADISNVSEVTVGELHGYSVKITEQFLKSGKLTGMSEVSEERGYLSIAGDSKVLNAPMKIVFINQVPILRLFTLIDDEALIKRYAESVVRRNFNTENAMKMGKPLPENAGSSQSGTSDVEKAIPVKFSDSDILVDSAKFMEWTKQNPGTRQFELCGALPLTTKEPVISLYEDGVKTREYTIQTEGDEDFSGKYFLISVRLGFMGFPVVPVAQIDGFISDTAEDRAMTMSDIGYRMEGHFLKCGGELSEARVEQNRGQDLVMKGLKYQGYTTPANIRLVGICPQCNKSFAFHGFASYMAQCDVAYSDDGLDCCEIVDQGINKDTWTCEIDGKMFRYYNSFSCPHCNTPYIDYKKHPQNKVFGVSGCVHLGRKLYRTEQ